MRMKIQKRTASNKGFTLVELLISMSILSIVIVMVASFLYLGSKSYSRANTEITKQMETQTVMNQLEDMIVESNWVKLINMSTREEALILYTVDEIKIIICNHDDNNLYLVTGAPAILSDLSAITYTKEENLMSDNVCDLKLLLNESEMKSKKELQLEVDFLIRDKDCPQLRKIHFRNQLVKPADSL